MRPDTARELVLEELQIGIHHQLDQVFELGLRLPAHLALGLGRIADEQLHLGWAVVPRIDLHVLLPIQAHTAERHLEALADRVRLVGRDHVVVGLGLLQHQPHRLDVFLGIPPVALRIEVAHEQLVLQPQLMWALDESRKSQRPGPRPSQRKFASVTSLDS